MKNGATTAQAWQKHMTGCTVAAKQQAKQCLMNKESLSTLTTSLEKTTLSAKAGQLALKGLAIAGNMAVSFGISLAIEGLIQLLDSLSTTLDEQKEKLEETQSKISDYEGQISDLENKISENKKKIDEINANPLDIVDKNTLSTLEAENTELDQQLETIKAIKEDAKELAEVQTVQILENTAKITGLTEILNNLTNGNIWGAITSTNAGLGGFINAFEKFSDGDILGGIKNVFEGFATSSGNIPLMIKNLLIPHKENEQSPTEEVTSQIKEIEKLYDEYNKVTDKDERKDIQSKISEKTSTLLANIKTLQAYKAQLDKTDPEQAKWIKQIQEVEDKYIAMQAKKDDYNTFDEIINSETYGKDKDKLIELAKQGKLTSEVIEENYHNLFVLFNAIGISADEAIEKFKKLKTTEEDGEEKSLNISFSKAWENTASETKNKLLELAKAGELTPETLESTEEYNKLLTQTGLKAEQVANKINKMITPSDQLASMGSGIKALSENLATKKEEPKKAISYEALAAMPDSLKAQKKEWKEYERVMGTASSTMEDCQKVTNDLAKAFINNANYLANLDEEHKYYYISQLKMMGIQNAEAIVTEALRKKQSELNAEKKWAKATTIDLANATTKEIDKLSKENKWTKELTTTLKELALKKQLVNGTTLDFSADLLNIASYVEGLGYATSAIKKLDEAKKGTLKDVNGTPLYMNSLEMAKLQNAAQQEIDDALNDANDIRALVNSTPDISSDTSSDTSKSAKKTKQAIDYIAHSLKVLQDKIDLTKAKFENLFTFNEKKNNIKQQIEETKDLINQTEKAIKSYRKEADKALGKIKSGKITITTSTGKSSGKDMVSIAESQLGYREGSGNNTKYGKFTGANFAAWCQSFVAWVADKAGFKNGKQYIKTASTDTGMDFYIKKGLFGYKGKYLPQRNDTVYFKSAGRSHTGIVEKVKNGKVYTIEGNSSDQVRKRSYSLNDKTITGYAKTSKFFSNTKTTTKNLSKKDVKEIQQLVELLSTTDKDLSKSMMKKKYGEKTYNLIQSYIGDFDKLQDAKKQLQSLYKELRELKAQLYQLYVDRADANNELFKANAESVESSKLKNKYIQKQIKWQKESYKYQILQAKKEKDLVKIATLRAQKYSTILELQKQQLQSIQDQAESSNDVIQTKSENANNSEKKAYLAQQQKNLTKANKDLENKLKDDLKSSNVKANILDSVRSTMYKTGKSTLNTISAKLENFKKNKVLTNGEVTKIINCLNEGKRVPQKLINKLKKAGKTKIAKELEKYNSTWNSTSDDIENDYKTQLKNDAETKINQNITAIREKSSESIQIDLDEISANSSALEAEYENLSSIADKNKNINKQMEQENARHNKAVEQINNDELTESERLARIREENAKHVQSIRENEIKQLQNYVDEAEENLNRLNASLDNARDGNGVASASAKNKVLKEQYKWTEQLYDYQIKIAEKENNSLKVATLREEKAKSLREIDIEHYQNLADEAQAEQEMYETEAESAVTAKEKLTYLDKSLESLKKQYTNLLAIARAEGDITEEKRLQAEYVQKIAQSAGAEFDVVADEINNRNDTISSVIDLFDTAISAYESLGYNISNEFYTKEKGYLEKEKNNIIASEKDLLKTIAQFEEKGIIGTPEYYKAMQNLIDIEAEKFSIEQQEKEIQNKINENELKRNEYINDRINALDDEYDFLLEIIKAGNELFDSDSGEITDAGLATASVYFDKMKLASENMANVRKEMALLNEQYTNGQWTMEEYTNKYDELMNRQRDAIRSYIDMKDAIIDFVEEGLNSELDSINELIDKYKKALEREKDLYNFQRNITKQTKNIAAIQKQIEALNGDNSEEARAKVQKLKVQLEEAKQDLEDTEYDKWYEDQTDMLDDLADELEKAFKDIMKDTDSIIESVRKSIVDSAGDFHTIVQEYIDKYGYNPSEDMNDIIRGTSTVADSVDKFKLVFDSWAETHSFTYEQLQSLVPNIVVNVADGKETTYGEDANTNPVPTIPEPDTSTDDFYDNSDVDDIINDYKDTLEETSDIISRINSDLYAGRTSDPSDILSTDLNNAFKSLTGNQAYVGSDYIIDILKALFGDNYKKLLDPNGNVLSDGTTYQKIRSELGKYGFNITAYPDAGSAESPVVNPNPSTNQKAEDAKADKIAGLVKGAHDASGDNNAKIQKYTTAGVNDMWEGDALNSWMYDKYKKYFVKKEKKEELLNLLGITPAWKGNHLDSTVAKQAVNELKKYASKYGFSNGGIGKILKPSLRASGEDAIAFVRNGEAFVKPEHVPAIQNLLSNLPLANSVLKDVKDIAPRQMTPVYNTGKQLSVSIGDISVHAASIPDADALAQTIYDSNKVQNAIGKVASHKMIKYSLSKF